MTGEAAIRRAVLDYFEGWFDGDAARMERALHADLAKRSPGPDGTLDTDTARQMIDATAEGRGKLRGEGDRRLEIEVVEVYRDIASVTVHSAPYREYLHLVRTPDGWKIANALWTYTQGGEP